jgi:hypothetical protein
MSTTPQVRRFTPDFTDARPALIEATDGGAYIRLGDVELAIVPPNQADADRTFRYAVQAHDALAELLTQLPAALLDLDALIAELGTPCTNCDGNRGSYSADMFGAHWRVCGICNGLGRVLKKGLAA